jgi:hypothetical protein
VNPFLAFPTPGGYLLFVRAGPYDIIGEAGRGGRGVVVKAKAPDGSLVAVKLLQHGADPESIARCERETRLLESLGTKDGFVPLIGWGKQGATPYIVMPFLAGGTLRDRLDTKRMSRDEAVKLALDLARAMAVAHERGIVHRDLKPENVIYTSAGEPLIADLGLGKHFKRDAPGASNTLMLSKAGQFRGTVGYMAPEQMKDAMRAGPPADVFAIGAILHECLSGAPAYQGESPVEVLDKIESGRHARLSSGERWVDAIVVRCLQPDPKKRYPDAAALAAALEAGDAGYVPALGKRRAFIIACAAATLLAVATLVALLLPSHDHGAEAATHLALARGEGESRTRLTEAKLAASLATGDDTASRTIRGEALEIQSRILLDLDDARGAADAARQALDLAPTSESRQLDFARAALKAGDTDAAAHVLEKRLDEKQPPLDAFRAVAASLLLHDKPAEAEALTKKGLALHGNDPFLLVARGRALRALDRPAEALSPLSAAERAGDRAAHQELALATIESTPLKDVKDPRDVFLDIDKGPAQGLAQQAENLLSVLEKNWPVAQLHPKGRDVALAALGRISEAFCKVISLRMTPKDWGDTRVRLLKLNAQIAGTDPTDGTGALAMLMANDDDLRLLQQLYPRASELSPRIRFAVRATLGIARFVPIRGAAVASCHFEEDEDESKGLAELDAALAEEAALKPFEEKDLFLRELHRSALRVRTWVLWHLAVRDATKRDLLPKAIESGISALAIPPAFEAYGRAPILVAFVPALLYQGKLAEAKTFIEELEGFHARWAQTKQATKDYGSQGMELTGNWGEVFELKGDLALREKNAALAAESFARAAEESDTRSAWAGLARARRLLGDEKGARQADARVRQTESVYLTWLVDEK